MVKRGFCFLLLGLLLFILTACTDEKGKGNIALLIDFALEWGDAKGIVSVDKDAKGNIKKDAEGSPTGVRPTAKTVTEAAGTLLGLPVNTGDKQADAALEAGIVLKPIVEAEQAANKGRKALEASQPDKAVEHFNEAIKKRPQDWSYRNQLGVALLEGEQGVRAGSDLYQAREDACKGGDTRTCGSVLKEQEQLLKESETRQLRRGKPSCYLYMEQAVTYTMLLRQTGDSRYRQLEDDARRRDDPRFGFCVW